MERDFWFSVARSVDALENPEEVGRKAAERALRRLGARKVSTQKVPVIFEPRVARTLLDNIFDAISGESVYRGETFLAGKLGQKVATEKLTVIDDATIPKLFGSSPFDDEGVPSRRTAVIEDGVLQSWLLNSYTARKLGMRTTGNASRGITGNAGVGHGNFYIPNGAVDPADIIKSVKSGFVRHGIDRFRSEHRHGRLFARRGRVVDRKRRVGLPGFGDHDREHLAGDAHRTWRQSARIWSSVARWPHRHS